MHRPLVWNVVVVLCTAGRSVAADRITLRDGRQILGTIQREAPTEITVEARDGTLAVPVSDVAEVRYDDQGAAMTQARIFEDANNFAAAAEQFGKAETQVAGKPLILAAARFGRARALARLALDKSSGLDEAIARLESFRREQAETRHQFPLHELLGRLHFMKKDYAAAAAAFDELARAPWPEAGLRADWFRGRMLAEQKKLTDAIARFDHVLAARADSAEQEQVQTEALLDKAACLREQNEREQEIAALEQAVERLPAEAFQLQANAYAALGDAWRATGKPKDALFAYLHVELLFPAAEEVHARALYNLAQLWSELGQSDRAAAARATLKSEHPNSPWTRRLEP